MGCNFYGSPFGYTEAVDNTGANVNELPFLAYGGAYVDTLRFYAGCKNTEGTYTRDDVFPTIWLEGWIGGQNVLAHANQGFVPYGSVLTDRKTLLSLDVRSTRETLTGAKFFVLFNGRRIDSLPTNVRRWYSSYLGEDGFEKTVNFILPPVPPSQEEIVNVNDCAVYADISGVSGDALGRPATDTMFLTGCGMQFKQPPARKFNVYVVPVKVWGFCSGTASVSNVTGSLASDFAAMFPIRPKDIDVVTGPPISVFCDPVGALNATEFWTFVNAALSKMSAITSKLTTYDRVVAVIPTKPGFGIDGSNSPWNRNLLLVREDQAEALAHEMGHSLRLADNYKGWPNATDGELLRGVTAFNPEMDGSYHIAPGKHFWANEQQPYTYDIMGAVKAMWPSKQSFQSFQTYFGTFTTTLETAATTQRSAPAARSVFFSASMVFSNNGYFSMDRASAGLFDVSGTGLTPGHTPDLTMAQSHQVYRIGAYDAQGLQVFDQFFLPDASLAYPAYYRSLDIPATATTVRLFGSDWASDMEWVKDNALAASLRSPQAGTTLTDTLTLTWQQSRADLQHLVLYSTDGGTTWEAISPPFGGDRVEISTEFLPAGQPIALRALTSDGFQHVETRVDGLTVANRPPTVAIQFPTEGTQAEPGFAWRLEGMAGDIEDQTTGGVASVVGHWASSLDGALGVGNSLVDVVLSPGSHVLTFAAQDSQGLTTERQVNVTVAPVTGGGPWLD